MGLVDDSAWGGKAADVVFVVPVHAVQFWCVMFDPQNCCEFIPEEFVGPDIEPLNDRGAGDEVFAFDDVVRVVGFVFGFFAGPENELADDFAFFVSVVDQPHWNELSVAAGGQPCGDFALALVSEGVGVYEGEPAVLVSFIERKSAEAGDASPVAGVGFADAYRKPVAFPGGSSDAFGLLVERADVEDGVCRNGRHRCGGVCAHEECLFVVCVRLCVMGCLRVLNVYCLSLECLASSAASSAWIWSPTRVSRLAAAFLASASSVLNRSPRVVSAASYLAASDGVSPADRDGSVLCRMSAILMIAASRLSMWLMNSL